MSKKAIDASKEIAAPFQVCADDINKLAEEHAKEEARRDALYKIVQEEHQQQIHSIHPPETVVPQRIELSRIEKLFLWYINGKCTTIENIGVYWYIDYQLYDYQACIQRLFDGGYLSVASPAHSLGVLPSASLKLILASESLPVSGTKMQLCKRIRGVLTEEEINKKYPHLSTFSCTDHGNRIIKESEAIIYLHQHKMRLPVFIDFNDAEKMANKYPNLSGSEVIGALVASKDKKTFLRGFADLNEYEKKDVLEKAKRRIVK